ncbi:MAG: DnaJ domain-containing protein [Pseudomonadota bacterium]
MGYFLTSLAMIAVILVFALAFINASPAAIASFIRKSGPMATVLAGLGMIGLGRGSIGLPVLMMGVMWWARNRRVSNIPSQGSGPTSTVRSAWLEMQLDHDTGELDGLVLTGNQEGQILSRMQDQEVISLYIDLSGDQESAALMEAYLDRRIPGWRENTDTGGASGERSSSGSGAMTKEEAYQILGLGPGASAEDIRTAHRNLMKAVHPDSGGSTFLAARINQAKDTLLD